MKNEKLERLYKRIEYSLVSSKRQVILTVGKMIKNILFNFKSVLYFEICYRTLVTCIFMPIIYFIVKYFMKSKGFMCLSNGDFLRFAATIKGAVCLIILTVIAFVVIFVEISVLTYISYNSHKKRKITLIESLFNSVIIIPKIFGRGMITLFIVTAFIGPLIGIGFSNSLIKHLTIPPFVIIELMKTIKGRMIILAFFCIIIFVIISVSLSIPELIIEDKTGIESLKDSRKIFKKNKISMILYMTAWVLFRYIALGILFIVFSGQMILISKYFSVKSIAFIINGGIVLAVFFIFYVVVSLITMPLFISFLVEIFYRLKNKKIEERKFLTNKDYKNGMLFKFCTKYSKKFIMCSIVIFISISCFSGGKVVFSKVLNRDVEISAHRGSEKKAPENSISSVRAAISDKADYAEIDVQTTKDGQIVLFHDNNLKRMTDINKKIEDLTYDEISKLEIGSYFSEDFRGERIPLLEDVLKEAKGRIKINIELKPMQDENQEYMVRQVVKIVKDQKMENQVVITSMNYDILQKVKNVDPELKVGYIIMVSLGNIENLNVDFLSIESASVDIKTVYLLHSIGKEVHVWTINNYEDVKEMISMGVDNIITDDVSVIKETENELKWTEKNNLAFYLESITNIMRYVDI
ncbi:glycerophosphodiester phosphodiesterase [Clostridium sp. BJN0001]|uniref:glycerophosphodiester phosphodiesterase n=1 Tax=Clostridium sp. BJN0001 TaxID=2930219 RepID=UPI001FCFBEE0|nr:glycerophosphodiester phosphodiesterase [Clostridium sp. BJN0001]